MKVDKYFRALGLHRAAVRTYEEMGLEEREMVEAYADGVNDYVRGIEILGSNPTGRLLPPEFLLLGITKENLAPWKPSDSVLCIKMLGFNLSWNWTNDLLREAFR